MESNPQLQEKRAWKKIHVVYYLSRRGHVDHPHLIEGYAQTDSQEGLRLNDVKRRLAVLRGKGMPNSFSWSYRRNYKNGFIWHDLSDNDFIQPLSKSEYVLLGSEITDMLQGKCGCGRVEEMVGEEIENKEGGSAGIRDPKKSLRNSGGTQERFQARLTRGVDELKEERNGKAFNFTAEQLLEEIQIRHRGTRTRSTECTLDAVNVAGVPTRETEVSREERARRVQLSPREAAGYKRTGRDTTIATSCDEGNMDAATQTGESTESSKEKNSFRPTQHDELQPAMPALECPSTKQSHSHQAPHFSLDGSSASPAQYVASTFSSATNMKSVSRLGHRKSMASSRASCSTNRSSSSGPVLLKHLLTCGKVDIQRQSTVISSTQLKSLSCMQHESEQTSMVQRSSLHPEPSRAHDQPSNSAKKLGSTELRPTVSGLSDGSTKEGETSPDSVCLVKTAVRISESKAESSSPGVTSVCSSTSRRSSNTENREELEGSNNTNVLLCEEPDGGTDPMQKGRRAVATNMSNVTISERHTLKQPVNWDCTVGRSGRVAGGSWWEVLWSPRDGSNPKAEKEKRRMKP